MKKFPSRGCDPDKPPATVPSPMSIDWRKRPDTVLLEDLPDPLKDSPVEETPPVSAGEKGFAALIRAVSARIK